MFFVLLLGKVRETLLVWLRISEYYIDTEPALPKDNFDVMMLGQGKRPINLASISRRRSDP